MRLIVALVLLTLTVPAWAEWVKYSESKSAVFYYDPATIKANGHFRSVWVLIDRKRAYNGALSIRYLHEFDCQIKPHSRMLSFVGYSGPMASGKVVESDGDMPARDLKMLRESWMSVNSVDSVGMSGAIACAK